MWEAWGKREGGVQKGGKWKDFWQKCIEGWKRKRDANIC